MSSSALQVARTGLDAQDMKMRVIANNLSNVNTTGFKRDRANFETLAYQQMVAAGAQSDQQNKFATGLNLGSGVRVAGTSRLDTQGTLNQTGNPLDFAIQGDGYFQVQQTDGTLAYSRAGNFTLSPEGNVVTTEGQTIIPQITVPTGATGVTVGSDGTVSATLTGQTAPTQLGQIELARFVNPTGLNAIGGNLLTETAASGAPQVGVAGTEGRGTVIQGSLEGSNVNTVEELVEMIETQRGYEVASKMIKATDEMMQNANQQL
ncbi:MAG TPA: flagellar basal-body rod protein FlgG [Sphingobium sp.]|uniref:flagellar basal-body rod protein FlgG n=1 Tax=Sphingobium sp. TaxID=1912891 RepID=UPI002ED25930